MTSIIPQESGDLITKIGRTFDAYRRLSQDITLLEVSPQADAEIKRLLRKRPDQHLTVFKIDQTMIPYLVNQQMIGAGAFKLKTTLGQMTPEMARARFLVNRSISR
jgi:hypothetical protein